MFDMNRIFFKSDKYIKIKMGNYVCPQIFENHFYIENFTLDY